MERLVIRGRRVVTPEGVRAAAVHVVGEAIEHVGDHGDVPADATLVEAADLFVLPGLVDTHVHVNEPGRTEWEGFTTATRAAAAGGVTTIVDMPLNSVPPTTTPEALEVKRAAAEGSCHVDVGFWGGAVPASLGSLGELHRAGVFGFKCFLVPSGIDEFPPLDRAGLRAAMQEIAGLGALLVVHAELPEPIERATAEVSGEDPEQFATYLRSRPPRAEVEAVQAVVAFARETGCRAHVVHVSAVEAVEVVASARADGVPVSAETCPHYLALAAEDVPDGAIEFKCAPPVRERANADRLWHALAQGEIVAVVSDHSPCPPEMKTGGFFGGWGGIASLQLGLRVVWTQARARGHGIQDVVRWMSEGPAGLAGLERKGAIEPGRDADLVLFDPDAPGAVHAPALEHRHPMTPYEGRLLDGRVVATYLRGMRVYADGEFATEPRGRLLTRDAGDGR